jgi:hypothetical protein
LTSELSIRTVAETRQNSGRSDQGAAEPPGPAGGTNAPAATLCADVIAVSAKVTDASVLQDAADGD